MLVRESGFMNTLFALSKFAWLCRSVLPACTMYLERVKDDKWGPITNTHPIGKYIEDDYFYNKRARTAVA